MTRSRLRFAVALVAASAAMGGCTFSGPFFPESVSDTPYQHDRRQSSLEVPPDLSSAGLREAYPIPGARDPSRRADRVLPEVPDMRVEREGRLRWLVVRSEPADLWDPIREFWTAQGFVLDTDDPGSGIMETGWATERQGLPVSGFRRALGRLKRTAYDYEVRDRFRTRVERGGEPGRTAIYVAHRGAHQVPRGDGFTWAPRPPEPDLELAMLRRLMLFLGREEAPDDAARAASAATTGTSAAVPVAKLMEEDGGGRYIHLPEGFDRSWRLAALALDRAGFTLLDRDRSEGLFLVRYIDAEEAAAREDGQGWFRRLTGRTQAVEPEASEYRIVLERAGDTETRIVMRDEAGGRDARESAGRILVVLAEQLDQ